MGRFADLVFKESTAVGRYFDKNPKKLYSDYVSKNLKVLDDKSVQDYRVELLSMLFPDMLINPGRDDFEYTDNFDVMDSLDEIDKKYLDGYFSKNFDKYEGEMYLRYFVHDDLPVIMKSGPKVRDNKRMHEKYTEWYESGIIKKVYRSKEYNRLMVFYSGRYGNNKGDSKYIEKLYDKIAKRYGVEAHVLEKVLDEMRRIQSKSGQRLDPKMYDAFRQVTVRKSTLPKVLYRGMFFDGAKIKDHAKFEKQWAVGQQPKASLLKATSWSKSIETARNFVMAQDNVKNSKDGYQIIIKLENPTVDEIIADFTRLGGGKFWNQQELIVDPSVKRYEVVHLKKGDEGAYKLGSGVAYDVQGAGGFDIGEMLALPFLINKLDIPIDTKIELRALKDTSFKDAIRITRGRSNKYMRKWQHIKGLLNASVGLYSFLVHHAISCMAHSLFDDSFESEDLETTISLHKAVFKYRKTEITFIQTRSDFGSPVFDVYCKNISAAKQKKFENLLKNSEVDWYIANLGSSTMNRFINFKQ